MRKKLLTIVTLLLIAVTCLAAGCKPQQEPEPFKLTLKNEVMRELLYINKEYSIDNIVEKEDGATYSFEDLFYFDDDFTKHQIEHSNGKFTQTQPYNVTAIIKGEKNGQSESKNVEIKINFNSNAYYDTWLTSWVDPGVVRALSARPEFLTGGAETAFSVHVMTTYNPIGDGVNIGNFTAAHSEFGVKDWSNVVLSMDVYNAADYDLQIGFLMNKIKDNSGYEIFMRDKLISKQWNKVTLSFRALGYTNNFFADGQGLAFKLRALGGVSPFDHTIYFCNVEVAEYSAEKFPDVETRTDAEIRKDMFDTLQGDDLDRKLVSYTTSHSNYTSTTDTKYTHSDESTSSIKYTYYYDGFTGDPTPYRANLMVDESVLFDEFGADIEYWDNVYLGFWLKNVSGVPICFGLRFGTKTADNGWKGADAYKFAGYTGQVEITDISGDWVEVKFSLSSLAKVLGFDYYTEGVTGLKVCFCTEISSLEEGASGSFYIDDIKMWSEKSIAQSQKEQYEASTGDEIDRKLAAYAWGDTVTYASATVDSDAKVGDSSIKYTFTQDDSHTPHGNAYRAVFLDDSTSILFNEYGANITDWESAYIGFWIKGEGSDFPTNASLVAKFKTTQNGTEWKGSSSLYFVSYKYNVAFGNSWKYMEFSLKDIIEKNVEEGGFYTTGVTGFRLVLSTEIVSKNGVSVSFLIDDLKIYNKAESDDFDIFAVSSNVYKWDNYTAEINHDSANIKEGNSSIKYTYTYNKAYYEGRNSQFFYMQSDFSSDIFGMKADTFKTENLYVGFWYKQSAKLNDSLVFGVRLENAVGGSYAPDWSLDSGSWNCRAVENDTEWQYVEFELYKGGNGINYPLAEYLNRDNVDQYRFSLFTICGENDNTATFYIDGLSIYTESKLA